MRLRLALSLVVFVGMLLANTGAAYATTLNPIVGQGVLNADAKNGDHRVSASDYPIGAVMNSPASPPGADNGWKGGQAPFDWGDASSIPGHNRQIGPFWDWP
ncbi:MAG: hypothetical protein Kow0056_04830 [Coriobacteriia bacterium]